MKIMLSGVGSVGSYLATILCQYYPDVTLVVRSKRKALLEQNGLVVHSQLLGDKISRPRLVEKPAAAGLQDVIFVCVKNYSLLEALDALKPCIDAKTIIVPVLNGVDHYEVTRAHLSTGRVLNALIYIFASKNPDASTNQVGNRVRLFLGGPDQEAAQQVQALLDHPGITCKIAEDIQSSLWQKYATNCSFNVITAAYRCNVKELRGQPERLREYRRLLEEACQVGMAAGVAIPGDLIEKTYHNIAEVAAPDVTSSMCQDVLAGRPIELETFSGYLTRLAYKLQVPVPTTEHFYALLKSNYQPQNKA